MSGPFVRVGVAALITSPDHPGCVLIGKRKSSHGFGKYAFPGGHLEVGETWAQCAEREALEETNLSLEDFKLMLVTNDIAMGGNPEKHYITIIMHASVLPTSGELTNMEPDKCFSWEWLQWAYLKELVDGASEDFFEPTAKAIRELQYPFLVPISRCV